MRDSRTHQPLTYDVRLPDEAQADALRLLRACKKITFRVTSQKSASRRNQAIEMESGEENGSVRNSPV